MQTCRRFNVSKIFLRTFRVGSYSSAVCAFTEASIETAFNGSFLALDPTNGGYKTVSTWDIPKQRPGQVR